jgi:NADH-quinone oxidoreductase subunit L
LITAGFWSKDEIIAEAWHGGAHHYFPLFVLLLLLIAALLTAFYTARMWFMTFWGAPRTPAAEHSGIGSLRKRWVIFWNRRGWSKDSRLEQEPIKRDDQLSANQMEFPLVVLAFFAIFAGFIGTPFNNVLHDFIGPTLLEEPEKIDFNFAPMLLSMIVALGGLGLGWWVYGRKPVEAGETDPVEEALGPDIWRVLQNRFYIDVLYRKYLLNPAEWFAEKVVIQAIDKETIDGVLETIADTFTWLGEAFKRFNTVVIDGFIDGIVSRIGASAEWFRQTQTGRVQQYLLVVTLALLTIATILIVQAR